MNTQPAFTNLQLELLRVFTRQVSDDDVIAIRKMLAQYFAEKAMNLADQVWKKNNWTDQDAFNMMNEHYRTNHESSH
jgi:hypothetical protein